MTVWASVTYQAWLNGASKTAQHDESCAFRRGFAPTTSMHWSVLPWQASGSSEYHRGRLPVFSPTAGCGLCLSLSAPAHDVEYLNAAQPIAAAKGTRLCRLSAATLDASATTSLEFPGRVHDDRRIRTDCDRTLSPQRRISRQNAPARIAALRRASKRARKF